MYPVLIYEENKPLPEDGTYFLVSGNGLWLHKDTGIVKGFVPVDNISCLDDLNADVFVKCSLPHIPARLVWRIKTFFKQVVERYDAEANTILYYSKEKNDFRVHIPEQYVSKGGVQYKRAGLSSLDSMEDYLRVGTIHSHCDFGAFHSGTDIGDEMDFDGLHCTFGHNDRDDFTISASIVMNGKRSKVDPTSVLEGISHVDGEVYNLTTAEESWIEGLDEWMGQVNGHERRSWFNRNSNAINAGDTVEWAGNLATVSFKGTCGEGPFTVKQVQNGKVTIDAKFGLARFSEKLFKKVS